MTALPGTMPKPQQLSGPTFDIGANLGKTQGNNLFHSFQKFNLQNGETAKFSGPTTILRIISRVTGGEKSTIDGKIQSTITGASLYFFNPQGVAFGPTGTLDVSGSFHVSTANSLGFPDSLGVPDKMQFPATLEVPPLSPDAPTSFGFLARTIPDDGKISIRGGTANPTLVVLPSTIPLSGGPPSTDTQPLSRTLSIVGRDIEIIGPASAGNGTVQARGGLIQIVSVRSAGTAKLTPPGPGQMADVNVNDFTALGEITVTGNALIDAGGRVATTFQPSGTILIRGGRLEVVGSSILSNTTGPNMAGAGASPVGATRAVDILLSGDLTLSSGARITAASAGALNFRGQSGEIVVDVRSLSVKEGSQIARGSNSSSTAQTGGIRITASDSITIDGLSSGLMSTPTRSESIGGITITGGATGRASLTMTNSATILSNSTGQGGAGDITLTVGPLTATGVAGAVGPRERSPSRKRIPFRSPGRLRRSPAGS